MVMDEFSQSNRILWNNWAQIHVKSKSYDVEGFKAGKLSLKPIELEELGEHSSQDNIASCEGAATAYGIGRS